MNLGAITPLVFSILAAFPSALAQTSPPNANMGVPIAVPPQTASKPAVQENRDAAAGTDARQCLDRPTNLEVIKCAEPFRPRKRNG